MMQQRVAESRQRKLRKAVVIGGAGFIGQNLVVHLHKNGFAVRSIDLRPHSKPLSGLDVESQIIDLRDAAATLEAVAGADVVFHLAGNPSGTISVEQPRLDFESNALSGFNVLEAVRAWPGTRLVYLSSAMVYGIPTRVPCTEKDPCRPFYPYGVSKLAVELWVQAYARTYAVDATSARAFVVYGPGEDPRRAGAEIGQYLRWHLNDMPITVTGDLDTKIRDFVHVDDVCTGLVVIAHRGEPAAVYNIGSGFATSLRKLLDTIGTVTGRPVRVTVDDHDLIDSYPLVADISRISALGYKPSVSLTDGITDLAGKLGSNPELPQLATILSGGSDSAGVTARDNEILIRKRSHGTWERVDVPFGRETEED